MSLEGPAETIGQQRRNGFFPGKAELVGRGVEIAADNPGERAHLSIGRLHCSHVGKQLAHRFFPDAHVFANLAAIAFQVQGINEEDLRGRELIGRKSEAAWRHDRAAPLPTSRPRR